MGGARPTGRIGLNPQDLHLNVEIHSSDIVLAMCFRLVGRRGIVGAAIFQGLECWGSSKTPSSTSRIARLAIKGSGGA